MTSKQTQEFEIYFAFVPEDKIFFEEIKKGLQPILRTYNIAPWSSEDILSGQETKKEIAKHLNNAQLILFLVSPDFLENPTMQDIVTQSLERQKQGNAYIIPILLRSVALDHTDFKHFKVVPTNEEPIAIWINRDQAYKHVNSELDRAIKHLVSDSSQSVQPDKEASKIRKEPCSVIYLQSIEKKTFEEQPPDCNLEWWPHFIPNKEGFGGYQLKDPRQWNTLLREQLVQCKQEINVAGRPFILHVYGASRLCCWFALGYVFRDTTGFEIKCPLKGHAGDMWSTEALPEPELAMHISGDGGQDGELIDSAGTTLALGISIARSVEPGIRDYLKNTQEKTAALLLLEFGKFQERPVQNDREMMALANSVRAHVLTFIPKYKKAQKLQIFYSGPAAGACFIGYRLNAIGIPFEIMEYNMEAQPKNYHPTFLF